MKLFKTIFSILAGALLVCSCGDKNQGGNGGGDTPEPPVVKPTTLSATISGNTRTAWSDEDVIIVTNYVDAVEYRDGLLYIAGTDKISANAEVIPISAAELSADGATATFTTTIKRTGLFFAVATNFPEAIVSISNEDVSDRVVLNHITEVSGVEVPFLSAGVGTDSFSFSNVLAVAKYKVNHEKIASLKVTRNDSGKFNTITLSSDGQCELVADNSETAIKVSFPVDCKNVYIPIVPGIKMVSGAKIQGYSLDGAEKFYSNFSSSYFTQADTFVDFGDSGDPSRDKFTPEGNWKLEWVENFDDFDDKVWNYTKRRTYQTISDDIIEVKNGVCSVWAREVRKDDGTAGVNGYTAGDMDSKGKKYFSLGRNGIHGRIDIRCAMDGAAGFWPALWLLTDVANYSGGAFHGEIDIMEHVNYRGVVYQTVHTKESIAQGLGGFQYTTPVNYEAYNIYSVEGDSKGLYFYINGKLTGSFLKKSYNLGEWAFDKSDFYILISNQISGSWVSQDYPGVALPNGENMPCAIKVDFIRYYTSQD